MSKQCLDYALSDDDCALNGIWAGTSPKQRREIQRARRKRPSRQRAA